MSVCNEMWVQLGVQTHNSKTVGMYTYIQKSAYIEQHTIDFLIHAILRAMLTKMQYKTKGNDQSQQLPRESTIK